MNIYRMEAYAGKRVHLVVIALLLFTLGGYGLSWYRNLDLDTLRNVTPDLPPSIPASEVVIPDYNHVPIQDSGYAVPEHYTIIEYRQKNCPECARLDQDLERFQKIRRDVAVRRIDMVTGWSDRTARRDYGREIYYTPFIVIYGADGRQIRADNGGKRRAAYLLYDWLKSEFAAEHKTAG